MQTLLSAPIARFAPALLALVLAAGCQDKTEVSVTKAKEHADFLTAKARQDVAEVRQGLPEGAKHLRAVFEGEGPPQDNPQEVRRLLERAREKVQDLRVAKSTFFAVTDKDGLILRNDRDQDLMVGKNLYASFPEARQALGKYTETHGSMPEAAGVKGRADAQWVAAQPIQVGGETKGLYVTGWSWSAYAYRLETALRSEVTSQASESEAKVPLLYVYVVVGDAAYGAPISPDVNAKAIVDAKPWSALDGGVFARAIEIEGREFGLAVRPVQELGPKVAIAVLRSET